MCQKILSILLLIAICITPLYAQKSSTPPGSPGTQEQTETLRIGTAVVQMDVIVTDKSGRRVKGLTAADFQVVDEGQPQTVDYFATMEGARVIRADNGVAAGNKGNEPPVIPLAIPYQGRHIALVFDDLSLSEDNFLRSRNALTNYINDKLGETDMAAIVSTGGMVGSLQQFTNDKQRLLSALNRITLQNTGAGRTRNNFRMTLAEATRIDSGDEVVLDAVVRRVSTESLANQLNSTPTLAAPSLGGRGRPDSSEAIANADLEALKTQIRGQARSLIAQSAIDIRNVLNTLENLFRSMADLPGRKIVVLLTEAFSTLNNSSEDLNTKLNQLIDLARRSGVSVYALDAAGLRTNTSTALASEQVTASGLQIRNTTASASFSDFEKLEAARALVSGTGGQLFANTNDIGAGLQRAIEDSNSYYIVGFKPAKLDNRFHPLTVTVKGKPDLVVRTRRGYLAISQETARGTSAELLDVLRSPIPRTALPLEVVANVVPKAGAQVVVTGLHIGRNYLTLPAPTDAQKSIDYDVLAYIFPAGRDQPVGIIKKKMPFDLSNPQVLQSLKKDGLLLAHTFTDLAPGWYQIRAVVRENGTGSIGSAYQFFEVPDVKNNRLVSLSSLVLTPAGQNDFGGHNTFKAKTEMDVRFIIYNLPKDIAGLGQRVTLMDDLGHTLMHSDLPLAGSGGQLQSLQGTRLNVPQQRGRYSLIVTLKDTKGKVEVERRADFIVE